MTYSDINFVVLICYVLLQGTITLIASIAGVLLVRDELISQKTATVQDEESKNAVDAMEMELQVHSSHAMNNNNNNNTKVNKKKTSFIKLYFKTVWKLRSVYTSLIVHTFDVLTDILVILDWYFTKDDPNDDINSRLMAYCGIVALVVYKIISTIAFWRKEHNIFRCMLQMLDLLVLFEIYSAHNNLASKIKSARGRTNSNKSNGNTTGNNSARGNNTANGIDSIGDVEATSSFKYVRSMEAVYESIPQSVLQLVYVMRTGNIEAIYAMSILQSIISMSNSIINEDYLRMQGKKWKRYKKRFPKPSIESSMHSISRISEVTYRIALLSIFWTICNGYAFSILIGTELLCVFGRILVFYFRSHCLGHTYVYEQRHTCTTAQYD